MKDILDNEIILREAKEDLSKWMDVQWIWIKTYLEIEKDKVNGENLLNILS